MEDQYFESTRFPLVRALLNISPSTIQRPSDPSAFMVSLLNAPNNLSAVPNAYAVDFAPAWLFYGSKIKYEDFNSDKLKKKYLANP